jgi:hypothetical protein
VVPRLCAVDERCVTQERCRLRRLHALDDEHQPASSEVSTDGTSSSLPSRRAGSPAAPSPPASLSCAP